MKRTLSWILSILMVLSCCTALFTISVSADVVNVAAGKSVVYTNARPTPAEQGYDGDITDGVTPGPDYSNNWRAFLAGTGTAVIDLEAVTSDLTGAAVWLWASNQGDGITKPGSIKFYVSDDNENWLVAGDADLSDPLLDANPSNPMWVIADFEEGTSGRYVKMEVETTGAFTFIAEVQVITGGAAVEATYTWLGIKTFAGYAGEDVNIFVRVGEATTVDEVRVALGAVSKTYAWYYFFVVDENDVITDILVDGSEADKKDTVIPEGGYIIGIHDAFDVSSLGAAVGDS
ncbi:MAG: discoidin domain-containing protein, partial [Clostridia bacterium]|nr:discoidin domain-containing protein [Clostridia bacterium]